MLLPERTSLNSHTHKYILVKHEFVEIEPLAQVVENIVTLKVKMPMNIGLIHSRNWSCSGDKHLRHFISFEVTLRYGTHCHHVAQI